MQKPLITVVLPTYKGTHTLLDTINSVTSQTFTNWELIVIDDNELESKERIETEKLLLNYTSNKIKYIQLDDNHGACFARNKGVDESKAEIIAFLDDDDHWHKDKLLIQYNTLNKHQNLAYCVCSYKEHLEDRTRHVKLHNRDLNYRSLLQRGFGLCTSAIMVRKSCFIEAGQFVQTIEHRQGYKRRTV